METREQILTELRQIAPFLGKGEGLRIPYTVPAGYFADFTEQLMIRIQLETAGFSDSAESEITALSPLLAGIRSKNTYQVPSGFFESLQAKIPANELTGNRQVSDVPESQQQNFNPSGSKVISMPVRILRYAAAACIVALIGIASFNIFSHRNISDPIMGLSTVSLQDMANYLDDDDIHWTPGVTSTTETASMEFNDDDIHDLLRGVPDIELEQYSASLQVQKGTVN